MTDKDTKLSSEGWPRSNGMTVPDGYFADFKSRMMAQLPELPAEAEVPATRTWWQRVKPYAYMAAMFAGVYLMLNIFTLTSGLRHNNTAETSAGLLTEVVNTNTLSYVDEYLSFTDYDLYDELYESGYTVPEL